MKTISVANCKITSDHKKKLKMEFPEMVEKELKHYFICRQFKPLNLKFSSAGVQLINYDCFDWK